MLPKGEKTEQKEYQGTAPPPQDQVPGLNINTQGWGAGNGSIGNTSGVCPVSIKSSEFYFILIF